MFMRRRAFIYSLMLPGPIGQGLRACLTQASQEQFELANQDVDPFSSQWSKAMRQIELHGSGGICAPLVTRSFNTIFNKARFAEANWSTLGPGHDKDILSRMTFLYERLQTSTWSTAHEVKYQGLKRREDGLIAEFRPICNRETNPGDERTGVTLPVVQQAILRAFATTG